MMTKINSLISWMNANSTVVRVFALAALLAVVLISFAAPDAIALAGPATSSSYCPGC